MHRESLLEPPEGVQHLDHVDVSFYRMRQSEINQSWRGLHLPVHLGAFLGFSVGEVEPGVQSAGVQWLAVTSTLS